MSPDVNSPDRFCDECHIGDGFGHASECSKHDTTPEIPAYVPTPNEVEAALLSCDELR